MVRIRNRTFPLIHSLRASMSNQDQPDSSRHLQILYVNGLPRSGTTLLMGLLQCFDQIVVPGGYPYEARVASYLAAIGRTIQSRSDDPWQFEKDNMICKLSGFPGYNIQIVEEWYADQLLAGLRTFLRLSLSRLAAKLAVANGSPVQEYLFWAEKFPAIHEEQIRKIFGGFRMITIIRNPVDVAVSRICANNARMKSSMWVADSDHELTTANPGLVLNEEVQRTLDLIMAHKKLDVHEPGSHLIVEYEDLINSSSHVIGRISEVLGVTCDKSRVDEVLSGLEANRRVHSSSDPASRLRLVQAMKTAASEATINALSSMGYCFK